jgi:hypothetical protein
MLKTRHLVGAAAAVAVAMSATGCGAGDYKHCTDIQQPAAQQQCIAQDNRGQGYFYNGFWYYGLRTLSRPGFSGVRYGGGALSGIGRAIGGFGESGHGSS